MSEENKKMDGYFIGIDLGKERVSAVAVTTIGKMAMESSCGYDLPKTQSHKGWIEQNPETWWESTCHAVGHLVSTLRNQGISPDQFLGVSVTSLPGNIAILSRAEKVLYPAIMAEDQRAVDQIVRLNSVGIEHCKKIGAPFKPEHAISKIIWIKDNFPDIYENAIFVHQSDYILGRLKGSINVTDASAARYTAYDPLDDCWPDWLDYDMHLSVRERLPKLETLGKIVGQVTSQTARSTGLPEKLPVVLGGCSQTAEFIASGVKQQGDFFTQFDETLKISGISAKMVKYPHNIVKMNRLPQNVWFLSTSMNTGTEWIDVWFNQHLAQDFITQIDGLLPSRYIAYPNVRKGELFPFCSNSAEGFISPATDNRPMQFASCIQGTALVERLAYQFVDKACANSTPGHIYTIGKWCSSDLWMQCRADVTERVVHRLSESHGPAFGAAMIAAMGTAYPSLQLVSEAMIHLDRSFFPNPEKMPIYKESFLLFQKTMQEQGYLL